MRSINFDAPHGADQKRIAFVRLMPPPLSWRSNGADQEVSRPFSLCSHETSRWLHDQCTREHGDHIKRGMAFQRRDVTAKSDFAQDGQQASSQKQGRRRGGRNGSAGSIDALADAAVRKLNSIEPKLQLAGQELQFVAQREPVHSFLHNPPRHSLHSAVLLLPMRTPNTRFTIYLWTYSQLDCKKVYGKWCCGCLAGDLVHWQSDTGVARRADSSHGAQQAWPPRAAIHCQGSRRPPQGNFNLP